MYKEHEIKKLYWSIGEVAEMIGVENTSQIRFWESEFEILHPKKNRKGIRQFTKQDIEDVRKIYYLVKVRRFTHAGAKMELAQTKVEQ